MKSIVLCETSLVEQTERIMEEEKFKDDSGGETAAVKLKKGDDSRSWSENSVIANRVDENKSCTQEQTNGVEKVLTNGDSNDLDDSRPFEGSSESPVKCDSSGVKNEIVDNDDRTKMPEDVDSKVNVNSVNNMTKSEGEAEAEKKDEEDSVRLPSVVKNEKSEDPESCGNEVDSSGAVSNEGIESEAQIPNESFTEIEEAAKIEKEESVAADESVSHSKTTDCEKAAGDSQEKSQETELSDGNLEKCKKGVSSDGSAEVSEDGVFDEEGNKENEKMGSSKSADVFTIEDDDDDDTLERATEVERACEDSGSNKYNIHVSDCQSVSVQDEDVSWGELQNAESSKDYEADASDESKEPGDYCPETTENETDEVEIEESKPLEQCEEPENPEDEVKIEDDEEETASTKILEQDADNLPEEESVHVEENFAVEETSIEIDAEALQHEEEATATVTVSEKTEGDSRKRSGSEGPEESETERKRRKTDDDEGVSYVDSEDEDEDVDDPLPRSSPPTFSDDSDAQVEKFENQKKRNLTCQGEEAETEIGPKKLKLAEVTDSTDVSSEINPEEGKLQKKSKTDLEKCIARVAANRKTLPFLENLRGTLKNLTRSDLEELTVQKLCEVITERSTVGELRRRAQALEQDQEKWKEKVQSLTKQIREMEMVMKKYMSEVQKQNKEKNFQIVTPIRVTRSVGLQVSFLPNANKNPRIPTGQSPTANATAQFDKRNIKTALPKTPLQTNAANAVSPNIRNKPVTPTTSPRTILSPQKNLVQMKKNFAPRPGVNSLPQNRPIAPQPLMNSNRLQQQNQITTIRPTFKVAAAPHQTGSKVIDLTDDDDKQMNQKALQTNPGARNPPGTVRVVNSLQQSQLNQNSRVAYLVPATTTTTGTGTPNRQFVIATSSIPTQNRQLVSSLPPLIFKGGNFVPAGAQATLVNQNVRPLAPKQFRHPAPLPQPPLNQIHRPNWKLLPPRPALKISRVQTGIVLSWNMNLGPEYEPIASYQLYAYQESNSPPTTSLWKKVGDVKALPLPMACTLTQFMTGHKYHFAVRAVDLHSRIGPFSVPNFIVL